MCVRVCVGAGVGFIVVLNMQLLSLHLSQLNAYHIAVCPSHSSFQPTSLMRVLFDSNHSSGIDLHSDGLAFRISSARSVR